MSYTAAVDHLYAIGHELAPATPNAPRRKFDLAHMRALSAALGNPHTAFPSVLIAGTNGKGSTAASLAGILTSAGYRTALYTSPHLIRVNERIQIDGVPIPDEDFARLYFEVDEAARRLLAQGALPHPPSFFEILTALAFCYFAGRRAEAPAPPAAPVDIAILEVGLGGRLDATNIVHPLLSILTDIALDHQDYLGHTLAEITREKAGILRDHGTLITLPQHPEANQAIGEAAATLHLHAISAAEFVPHLPPRPSHPSPPSSRPIPSPGAPYADSGVWVPPPPAVTPASPGAPSIDSDAWVPTPRTPPKAPTSSGAPEPALSLPKGLDSETWVPPAHKSPGAPSIDSDGWVPATALPRNRYTLTLDNQPLEVDSPLPGHHQQRNLALAIAAAAELRNPHSYTSHTISNQISYNIANPAIEAGIRNTKWPGRLEFFPQRNAPGILLDVAHNPAGAWTLRAAIAQLPDAQPRTLIFSCLRDKDLREIAQILLPLFDSSPGGDPARKHDHILLAPLDNPRAASLDDLLAAAHALDIPAHAAPHPAAALAQARTVTPPHGLILATGSVYLVGEIRRLLLAEQISAALRQDAALPHDQVQS